MGETAAVEDNLVAERGFHRLDVGGSGNTNLAGFDFSADREIEKTFFFPGSHIFDNPVDGFLVFVVVWKICHSCPEPFPVLFDVEVEASVGTIGIPVGIVKVHFNTNGFSVGCEQHSETGCVAALHILPIGETFETASVDSMVRVGGVVECLSHEIELRCLNFKILIPVLCGKRKRQHQNGGNDYQFLHIKY